MQIIERKGNPVFSNLRRNIQTIGSVALQKKIQDIQRQQELQDAVRKAVITSVLSGKGKFKTPVDINQIIAGGQLPNLSEFQPIVSPTTSISISEIPYSERLKAREIGARTPAEWSKLGMATKKGGWFGNWGPGSKWEISPEAQAAQTEAAGILKSPYRVSKRLGYRGGDIIDTTGIDVTDLETALPDASEYEEGTTVQMDDGSLYKVVNGQWVLQE